MMARQTATGGTYMSLRVDGTGQYFVTIWEKEAIEHSYNTGIYNYPGLNYFAVSLERQTETTSGGAISMFNQVTVYAGHNDFET